MQHFYIQASNSFRAVPDGADPADYGIPEDAIIAPPECMEQPHKLAEDGAAIIVDLDLIKAAKKQEINARLALAFLAGFTPTTGPLAGHTLQCRNEEDRTNWLASAQGYSAAIAGGFGNVEQAVFRTAANATVTTSYSAGFEALMEMQQWGGSIMACSWRLKDALDAAEDLEAVQGIDVEAEAWPS